MRQKTMLAVLACAFGCAKPISEGAELPVDMVYRATLTSLKNSCRAESPPAGTRTFVDVRLRSDGNFDISHQSGWIPGTRMFKNVTRTDGRVEFREKLKSPITDRELERGVQGVVTAREIDLTFLVQRERISGDGNASTCEHEIRAVGTPRSLFDPASFDGKYALTDTSYTEECPGGPPRDVTGRWNTVMDIDDGEPDALTMTLFGLQLRPPRPAADGTIDWTGMTTFDLFFFGSVELNTTIKGTLKPDDADFQLLYGYVGDESGCSLEKLKGKKRIPALDAIENEYRVSVKGRNECRGEDIDFEGTVELLTQDAGLVELLDGGESVFVFDNKNGALAFEYVTTDENGKPVEEVSVVGTVTPPLLDLKGDYRGEGPNGPCTVSYQLTGHARYVFE